MPSQEISVSQQNAITINMTGTDEQMVDRTNKAVKDALDSHLVNTKTAVKKGK
jgi:hypothetical protein